MSPTSATTPSASPGWTQTPQNRCYVYSYTSPSTSYGGGAITQTIFGSFAVGTPYQTYISARDTVSGTVPTIGISLNGGATANQTFSILEGGPHNSYSLNFTPDNAGAITMTIGGGSYPLAIDSMFLVPEPSNWTLLGAGAMGVGILARRWRTVS